MRARSKLESARTATTVAAALARDVHAALEHPRGTYMCGARAASHVSFDHHASAAPAAAAAWCLPAAPSPS
jgi:hypothetical protein